jgi:hypothetical protein
VHSLVGKKYLGLDLEVSEMSTPSLLISIGGESRSADRDKTAQGEKIVGENLDFTNRLGG